MRVIACLSKFDHVSDTLKELHWLPVEQRVIFKINLICFKILNNLAPDYLVDLIHVYEPARYLRSSSDKWRLVIKPYNLKTYGFRAFSVIAPILWNDLPVDIRSIDDVNKFKSKLKTFLASLRTILGFLFCIFVTMYIYNICNDFSIFISYSDLFEAL